MLAPKFVRSRHITQHESHPIHTITATLRATGHDGLPNTYYLLVFPRGLKRVGTTSQFMLDHETKADGSASYTITLGQIRLRDRNIVEFIAFGEKLPHGFCYVQVPAFRATVSRFPIIDALRGLFFPTYPIPERRVATTQSESEPDDVSGTRASGSIKIYIEVTVFTQFSSN
ncbi:hypothetical protein VTO73DRAFT_6070 [Trametes versicolor]